MVAACAGYLTSHSFGDFVYDWNWARIAEMHAIDWYPKWVIEVPYSPVSGSRLQAADRSLPFRQALIDALIQISKRRNLACLQVNYCQPEEAELLQRAGFILRPGTQLHWHNHAYQSFADFTAALTRKRRKEILRERRKVAAQNITHRWVAGDTAKDQDIQFAHACYQKTFTEYGNYPALGQAFWRDIGQRLAGRVQFCIASQHDSDVACAIFLSSDSHLYGRYWGSLYDIDCLHFETCFYQGIEYCIANTLQVFEPGAGGGHKLNRGFLPSRTYTAHWVNDSGLAQKLAQLAHTEAAVDQQQQQQIGQHTPFRAGPGSNLRE